MVESDGVVSEEETAWLEYIKKNLGQDAGSEPFDPAKLKAEVERKGEAEALVSLLLMVSLADGNTDSSELGIVHKMADLVNVSPARVEELKGEAKKNLGIS